MITMAERLLELKASLERSFNENIDWDIKIMPLDIPSVNVTKQNYTTTLLFFHQTTKRWFNHLFAEKMQNSKYSWSDSSVTLAELLGHKSNLKVNKVNKNSNRVTCHKQWYRHEFGYENTHSLFYFREHKLLWRFFHVLWARTTLMDFVFSPSFPYVISFRKQYNGVQWIQTPEALDSW